MSTIRDIHAGWDVLLGQAGIISLLPLEDWLVAFERAEAIGPILDPTLYRQYLYDPEKKGQVIKEIIEAAIPLKQAILKARARYAKQETQADSPSSTSSAERTKS